MKVVNSLDFDNEVLRGGGTVLVDFYTDECGPCKNLAPVLEQIGLERAGHLKIVKVDAGMESALASRFGVNQVPSLFLFQNGEVVAQRVGNAAKAMLLRWIDEAIGKTR
jgi:thioredoxin 1